MSSRRVVAVLRKLLIEHVTSNSSAHCRAAVSAQSLLLLILIGHEGGFRVFGQRVELLRQIKQGATWRSWSRSAARGGPGTA